MIVVTLALLQFLRFIEVIAIPLDRASDQLFLNISDVLSIPKQLTRDIVGEPISENEIYFPSNTKHNKARPTSQDRSSDPISFGPSNVLPIPIGDPISPTGDSVGAPISETELHSPPFIVDPPIEGIRDDPIEKAGLFEGDIIVQTVDEFLALTNFHYTMARNAEKDKEKLWHGGIIPYLISSTFDRYERGAIAFAMKEFQDNTCIRFKGMKNETDYLRLIKADGCSSSVGKVGGSQVVSLGNGCLTKGVVIHELMHSMGFWHEQSRPDRDKYVTIIWNNIQDELHYNFGKHGWDTIQNLSVPYDLGSIMHYGSNAFARDKKRPTIITNNGEEIGQRYGLSEKDIVKINILYKCNETASSIGGVTGNLVEEIVPEDLDDPLYKKCTFWASNGECKNNRPYMMKYCLQACSLQEEKDKNGVCKDSNASCQFWADIDQCNLNSQYMSVFCKKSCNQCSKGRKLTEMQHGNFHLTEKWKEMQREPAS